MTDTVSFGYEEVPEHEKVARVGAVFSGVARKYDVMNDAMSVGMHRLWKDTFVRRVKPREGEAILDMAGGTGDIAFRMAPSGAQITVADINQDMLDVGVERAMKKGLDGLVWSCQNAEELAFPDRSFDAYTIAFGIRNVTHIDRALAEAYRVLKFGGRFYCLEFSTTEWPGFAEIYHAYSHKLVPRIVPLPDRIDPPLPADAALQVDDRAGRLHQHQGRTDPWRSGRDPLGLEGVGHPPWPVPPRIS
jgi:demethylmenaquinone methyltransferase/2-methoxy-6-polyprenyl-1,4-benzoquinol methylase